MKNRIEVIRGKLRAIWRIIRSESYISVTRRGEYTRATGLFSSDDDVVDVCLEVSATSMANRIEALCDGMEKTVSEANDILAGRH